MYNLIKLPSLFFRALVPTGLMFFAGLSVAQNIPRDIESSPQNQRRQTTTLSEEGFIQSRELPTSERAETIKGLSLNIALEQGLRQNFAEQIRDFRSQKIDLEWEDIFTDYWYPRLELRATTSAHRVGTVRSSESGDGVGTSSPTGEISLGFEDYTLFNWGRDYLRYLNAKELNEREKERLSEQRRELKHKIIITYANLITATEIQQIKREQLRHTSYIYNLNREKVTAGNISRQDYYQSRSEYLRSQTDFYQARVHAQRANELMAELLADPSSTRYSFEETLEYRTLKITPDEAIDLAKNLNPQILDAQTDIKVSSRSYDLARRENLPLPTFNLTLGAYQHEFGEGRSNSTRFRTGPGSSDVEIVASINASWALLGRGGVLNSRHLKQSYLDKRISEKEWQSAEHEIASSIQQHIYLIRHYQDQVEILKARELALKRTFDTVMQNYLDGNTPFQEFRQVLIEKIEARELMSVTRFQHIKQKVELASTIGLEDFPGENFEDLITR